MGKYILSSMVGTNADVFLEVGKLYISEGDRVADVTYGKGIFWKNMDTSLYEFYPSDIAANGVDFRDLPYEDCFFDVVVLDPPYLYNPKATIKESISTGYGLNRDVGSTLKTTNDVLALYKEGIRECSRVLKVGGKLLVKCQDGIEAGKQRWQHIKIYQQALDMGLYAKDLFVVQMKSTPTIRWPKQKHARKNHSYLWVFETKKR